jgi:hypothetical protein
MIALEVSRNGRRLCTASAADGSVNAFIHLPHADPEGSLPPPHLSITGLQDFVRLHWSEIIELTVGDEIAVRVIDASTGDLPRRQVHLDADAEEAQERLNYERLKRKYERK